MRSGGDGDRDGPERAIVYCVIPADLAPSLHDLLRRHFRDEPNVEVVVEHRGSERRSSRERRVRNAPPPGNDRRRIRATSGRRIADRRAPVVAVETPPPLPRRARRHQGDIAFVERLEPPSVELEDRDTARLIARFQTGEREVFSDLYSRYFDRVYGYLRVALNDPHEAEDVAQEVFVKMMESLPGYERRRQPFRAFLFVVVRNTAISRLRKLKRISPEEPRGSQAERTGATEHHDEAFPLEWITDRDLVLFVERLPMAQRQVLMLRYMLDLPPAEVARVLGRSTEDVRKLQQRALKFLRQRLASVGRVARDGRSSVPFKRPRTQVSLLRRRRFALMR